MSADAESILAELKAVAEGPLSAARAMPPAMYHDEEIAALEVERLFAADWLAVGLAAEVPEPGDFQTFSIADEPVVVLRGDDGQLRCFANVCRHRMMVLLEGRGSLARQRITCPYHAWTYDTHGQLIAAGHMQRTDGFEKSSVCLPEFRLEEWHGWIYVTLNPDASPIASLLKKMEPFVERFEMEHYVPVVQTNEVWNTNWKFLTENFAEGYHLPVAHAATVGAWMPMTSVVFPDQQHEAFTYQMFVKDENAVYGRAHDSNTRLEGEWRYTTFMPTIFPSHMYILAPDHLWYLSLRPNGPDQVHVRFGMALAPEVHAALDGDDSWTQEMAAFFGRVNNEDRVVVEGIHAGSSSAFAKAGPLSWLEHELHDLMGYLARRLSPESSE